MKRDPQDKKEVQDGVGSVAESQETNNSFRRLTHSRSSLLRYAQGKVVDVWGVDALLTKSNDTLRHLHDSTLFSL